MNDHTAPLSAIITTGEKEGGIETPGRIAKITRRAGKFTTKASTFGLQPPEKLAAYDMTPAARPYSVAKDQILTSPCSSILYAGKGCDQS